MQDMPSKSDNDAKVEVKTDESKAKETSGFKAYLVSG